MTLKVENPWERPRAEKVYNASPVSRLQKYDRVVETASQMAKVSLGTGLVCVFGIYAANLVPNDIVSTIIKYPTVIAGLSSAFCAVGAGYNVSRLVQGKYLHGSPKIPKL